MWTGIRNRARLVAIARVMACRTPPRRVGGELVAAAVLELVHGLHQPDVPLLSQIRNCRPRLVYFFAIETTSRRFASTSSFLACSACASPRRIVSERPLQLVGGLAELVCHALDLGLQVPVPLRLDPPLLLPEPRPPFRGFSRRFHRLRLSLESLDLLHQLLQLVDSSGA